MQRPSGLSSAAVAAVALLCLSACAKQEEPAPVAVAPLPPPPPPAPPAPTADDQLNGHLGELGARPSDGGWTLTLTSAKFKGGKVAFAPEDEATVNKIVTLLKDDVHVRMQIEDYTDRHLPKAKLQELSQMHANAVLRDMTAQGADEGRIQAQGHVDAAASSRIEIIFSNAEGEFRAAPVENS